MGRGGGREVGGGEGSGKGEVRTEQQSYKHKLWCIIGK